VVISSQKPVEDWSERHRVNEDGVIAVDIEHADLQQRAVAGWADQHRQFVVHDHAAHRGARRVQHVDIGDAVLTGWDRSPLDNVACLGASVNDEGVDGASRRASKRGGRDRDALVAYSPKRSMRSVMHGDGAASAAG
jgi:hypothetical protein